MKRCVLTGGRRGKEEEEKTGGGGDRKEGWGNEIKVAKKGGRKIRKVGLIYPPLRPSIPSHAGHL